MKKINVALLIPSLSPDEKLIMYINDLIEIGFKKIIVVNDGSNYDYDSYFNEIKTHPECIVLRHVINQGKGRALKTGFNYYLENLADDFVGIVTADSDGQHSPKDTLNVARELEKNSKQLVLGTRNFNLKTVPFKSKFGNKITTFIFKLLYGKKINDTQTGLRGIGNELIKDFSKLIGEKFDLEINQLINVTKNNIEIKEVIIETIYIQENKSSHFHPIKDSLKIYKVLFTEFFKFGFTGILSFLVDILIFYLLINKIFMNVNPDLAIISSTIIARIVSSIINFTLNKNIVFNSHENNKKLLIKYYILCACQLISSALLADLLFRAGIFSETICKIIVDSILFVISFCIQKRYIFRR